MSVQWLDNTGPAPSSYPYPAPSSYTWATCPSCGARYQGYHNCWTVAPQPNAWPMTVYYNTPLLTVSDADVDRIARRVAELLREP